MVLIKTSGTLSPLFHIKALGNSERLPKDLQWKKLSPLSSVEVFRTGEILSMILPTGQLEFTFSVLYLETNVVTAKYQSVTEEQKDPPL